MPKKKKEQEFVRKLCKWLKFHAGRIDTRGFNGFGPVEAKVSYSERFSIVNGFKKGQLENLNLAREGTAVYKISDLARINSRPWDIDVYYKSMAMVAIQWVGNPLDEFYLIHPEVFQLILKHEKKSITEDDARRICFEKGILRK